MSRLNSFQAVYSLVKTIPSGKVSTYGEVAHVLRLNPRTVGWALHGNKDSRVPCHRVVDRTGRVAPSFAFDGWREQKRRLEEERVMFKDEMHVDLRKCLFIFREYLK